MLRIVQAVPYLQHRQLHAESCGLVATQLLQQFLGRYIKWIRSRYRIHNYERMRAHHSHHDFGTELGGVIYADRYILVFWPDQIEAAFVLDDIRHAREVLKGPFLIRPKACSRITLTVLGKSPVEVL